MIKGLMISMQPQEVLDVINGKKKLDLRKWIPKGYVGPVYVCVTKSKPYLFKDYKMGYLLDLTNDTIKWLKDDVPYNLLNGKVVFRFWFDDYIAYQYHEDDNSYFPKRPQDFGYEAYEVLQRLCLSREEFKAYGKGKDVYAWHIKKLEVFETPKDLSEFYKTSTWLSKEKLVSLIKNNDFRLPDFRIKKAPQKFCYCYVEDK